MMLFKDCFLWYMRWESDKAIENSFIVRMFARLSTKTKLKYKVCIV